MGRVIATIFIAIGIALLPVTAWAEASSSDRTTQVGPDTSGPTINLGSAGFNSAGTDAAASSHTKDDQQGPGVSIANSGPGLTFSPINTIPVSGTPWVDQSGVIHVPPALPVPACPPGQTGFAMFDATGAFQGITCVASNGTAAAAPAASPLQLAEQASAQQPWPRLVVNVNPARGLTGLPSWFWLAGGSPTMPDVTASAGGLTVTVRATLARVTWDFGDHATLDTGTNVGRPFPAQGGVQHVYQTDTFGMPAGAQVRAFLTFRVTFSVNAGPFRDLGLKSQPYTASYVVNQLQPEAVNAQ
jgi:hypothetical protein